MLKHRLVAHRGYPRKYPENTLLGIEKAVEAGAKYIEIDIQFTRDLEPVIYHDQSLVRVSGVPGNIHEMPASQVLGLPASEPFRLGETYSYLTISHLRDLAGFLEGHPQVSVFVELKKEALSFSGYDKAYQSISDILGKLRDQIILISFDIEFIAFCRAQYWPCIGVVLTAWEQIHQPVIEDLQPDYIFADIEKLPSNLDFDQFKSMLVVYEIDDPKKAMTLLSAGVDMVETFDIGGMMTELGCHSI